MLYWNVSNNFNCSKKFQFETVQLVCFLIQIGAFAKRKVFDSITQPYFRNSKAIQKIVIGRSDHITCTIRPTFKERLLCWYIHLIKKISRPVICQHLTDLWMSVSMKSMSTTKAYQQHSVPYQWLALAWTSQKKAKIKCEQKILLHSAWQWPALAASRLVPDCLDQYWQPHAWLPTSKVRVIMKASTRIGDFAALSWMASRPKPWFVALQPYYEWPPPATLDNMKYFSW